MEREEEMVIDETVLGKEEEIQPFDWEDHLYESWLEEQWEQKRKRMADAGPSI